MALILVYIYNFEIMLDSVGLGWTRLDPVELGPPLYYINYIKRGLLFKFLMEGLILERGLLLVYIRYKVHHILREAFISRTW